MGSRSVWLCVAVWMVFVLCLGCEEQPAEKQAAPPEEKAEVKKAPQPAAPIKKAEKAKPARKTRVTVAKITPPPRPEPAKKEPAKKAVEPEKKVAVPKPKTPPAIGPCKAEEKVWIVDDFEKGNNYWQVETWANPATLSIADGELKVELSGGKQDKSAIARAASLDMSDRSKLMLDVRNNTKKDVKLAIAFMTGGSNTFFETEPATVKPGTNKSISFDLKSEKFKSAATGWKHSAKLSDANAVKRVVILVYGDNKGEVRLDNIRFEK
ncbi:MAG: hypothetical protein GXP25_14620 [Planctomycetes bacterium]|nr:hypothetical protein [Planctomycetota bacterium]